MAASVFGLCDSDLYAIYLTIGRLAKHGGQLDAWTVTKYGGGIFLLLFVFTPLFVWAGERWAAAHPRIEVDSEKIVVTHLGFRVRSLRFSDLKAIEVVVDFDLEYGPTRSIRLLGEHSKIELDWKILGRDQFFALLDGHLISKSVPIDLVDRRRATLKKIRPTVASEEFRRMQLDGVRTRLSALSAVEAVLRTK